MSDKDEEYFAGMLCTCCARNSSECACGADWTPKEVYDQDQQITELKAHVEDLKFILYGAKADKIHVQGLYDEIRREWIKSRAHVERLRGTLLTIKLNEAVWRDGYEKALNETPAQSLNEIKAGAVEGAVKRFAATFDQDPVIHESDLLFYAKQLREGE